MEPPGGTGGGSGASTGLLGPLRVCQMESGQGVQGSTRAKVGLLPGYRGRLAVTTDIGRMARRGIKAYLAVRVFFFVLPHRRSGPPGGHVLAHHHRQGVELMSYRTITIDGRQVNPTTTTRPRREDPTPAGGGVRARTEMTVPPGRSEFQKVVRFVRLDKAPS